MDSELEEQNNNNEINKEDRSEKDRLIGEIIKEHQEKLHAKVQEKHEEVDVEEITDIEHAPIIVLENVMKEYKHGTVALQDINIRINKGEFVFIVGSSGSGKSTLMKLMLKEVEPNQGKIYVNGYNFNRIKRKQIPKLRRTIGVVFQDFRLLRDRNVYENVAFAQRIVNTPTIKIRKRVPEVLSLVGLTEKLKANPKELSGGEQQRVALARAIVNKPVILLADEPTGNLDPKTSWEIMSLLEEINKMGTTVVVVTHNSEIVDAMKKRVIKIEKGILVSDEQRGGYSND